MVVKQGNNVTDRRIAADCDKRLLADENRTEHDSPPNKGAALAPWAAIMRPSPPEGKAQ
jgi:hypothetical protein